MKQLRRLGDELDMPIAVHALRSRIGIDNLLPYLKKGDVLCHTLAGNSDVMRVLDEEGRVRQCVIDARKRGVVICMAAISTALYLIWGLSLPKSAGLPKSHGAGY